VHRDLAQGRRCRPVRDVRCIRRVRFQEVLVVPVDRLELPDGLGLHRVRVLDFHRGQGLVRAQVELQERRVWLLDRANLRRGSGQRRGLGSDEADRGTRRPRKAR
jgi:hypothetical protein